MAPYELIPGLRLATLAGHAGGQPESFRSPERTGLSGPSASPERPMRQRKAPTVLTPEREKLRAATKKRNAEHAAANRKVASDKAKAHLQMPPLRNAEKAHIGPSKIGGYLLNDNHPDNLGKAKSMAALGFLLQSDVKSGMTAAQFRSGVKSIEEQIKRQVLTKPAVTRAGLATSELNRVERAQKDLIYGVTHNVNVEIAGPVNRETDTFKRRKMHTSWIYVKDEVAKPGQKSGGAPNLTTIVPAGRGVEES